jgi:hypothetical protein
MCIQNKLLLISSARIANLLTTTPISATTWGNPSVASVINLGMHRRTASLTRTANGGMRKKLERRMGMKGPKRRRQMKAQKLRKCNTLPSLPSTITQSCSLLQMKDNTLILTRIMYSI